ncbi:TonB-dependent siderophore receptor [Solimonas sp. K1W22B-7]|uniref:TonB-dependent siderophore receptor n=1 Tax=Solimonas sp. K1W22B-7 TaxID=2303331 RepID=UPI000E331D62|nr:TonB-dependent siderophore receptor [Solimonas sp. K1W22B-7]AXQ29353.1 TonB-dependent siderophore receptor [Solimonas sp. K1W22B-7]
MTMQYGRLRPLLSVAAGVGLAVFSHGSLAQEAAPAAEAVPEAQAAAVEEPAKAGAEEAVILPAVTVTDTALHPTTEGSGSYTSRQVTIGKTPQSIRETPQAVTVITRQRLDDQNLTSVPKALKQATGVTVLRFDGAGNFNNYYLRGYQVDAIQLDGINFGATGNVVEFDTAMYDRVEILHGPGGLFQGSGEPSGVINLARKRALASTQFGGASTVGSWDTYRTELDATGALTADGRLRGRVVGAYNHQDSYQDVVGSTRQMLYGTLEYDLTPATTLSAGIAWQDIDAVIDQGLPAYANGDLLKVPRSTFIGADWNKQELESTDLFTELEHRLANGGYLKASVRKLDRYMLYRVARANSAVDVNTGNVNLQTGIYSPDRENLSADIYASLPFELWGLTHNLTTGFDWRKQEEEAKSTAFANTATMNVFNPDHNVPQPNWVFNSLSGVETRQYGAYAQLRIKPLAWATVVGGGRLSWWESQSYNRLTGARTADYDEEAEFTPYAALLFDVTPDVSLYASWAEVFQPQNNMTVDGSQLPPRTGRQYEAGVKAELLQDRLNAQFAVFRIRDNDRAIADPNPPTPLPPTSPANPSISAGEVESQGFETELAGRILPGWDLTLGYAYVDTEYLRGATTAQTGQSFSTATPRHVGNLWSKYEFGQGVLRDLSIGAGIKAVSSFYAQSGAVRFWAPAYTVVSAQLGYRLTSHWQTTLSADNLFDEKYYEKVSGAGRQNFYGEPVNMTLVLRGSF